MRKRYLKIITIFIILSLIFINYTYASNPLNTIQQQQNHSSSGSGGSNSGYTPPSTMPPDTSGGGSSGTTSATHPDADAPGGQTNSTIIGGNSTSGSSSSGSSSSGSSSSSDSTTDSDGSTSSDSSDHPIYQQPRRDRNNTNTSAGSLDDMMNDADDFVRSGGNIQYNEADLQNFSSNFYNIMFSIGVAVAVIVGGVLGIKLMLSSVEERAETKKLLIAYAVGCVIVFGGFGIWKLVVTILQGI